MDNEDAKSALALALTQADLGKIPPSLRVATSHDDAVMLFFIRVGDPQATTQILMCVMTLSEAGFLIVQLKVTRGLLRKQFPLEDAYRLKDQLASVGTDVEFVRPDEPK